MKERRFIFTVTTGRSGTKYLSYVLGLLRGVQSRHEPAPNFVECMRESQHDAEIARRFLSDAKIPHYAKTLESPTYVETSHLFCKGLLDAWMKNDRLPTPDIVCLWRDPRKVASSMLKLGTVPGRTAEGLRWYLSPEDPTNVTRLADWRDYSDYQLCYWYCMEIKQRQKIYAREVQKRGGKAVWTEISEVARWKGLLRLMNELELPVFDLTGFIRYLKNGWKRINAQDKYKDDRRVEEIGEVEEEIESNLETKIE